MRPEYYADLARRYGLYCRDHGENRLYRIACGANVDDYRWTQTLMSNIGDVGCGCHPRNHFQGLSLHHYTFGKSWEEKGSATAFGEEDYWSTMSNAFRMDELITRHSTIMDVYDPSRRVGLVVDEWGTWWEPEPGTNPGFLIQRQTLRDALVAGLTLDIFHQHAGRVVMANLAQTVNVLQSVLVTRDDELIRTPTWHVFRLARGHMDGVLLPLHWRDDRGVRHVVDDRPPLPLVHGAASRKGDEVTASFTNLDLEQRTIRVDLRGARVVEAAGEVLSADRLQDEIVTVAPAERVRVEQSQLVVDLPPASFLVSTLRLDS